MKGKIVNALKFGILCYAMVMGFFASYAIAWVEMGLPIAWWASVVVIAISALSTWGYIEWIQN